MVIVLSGHIVFLLFVPLARYGLPEYANDARPMELRFVDPSVATRRTSTSFPSQTPHKSLPARPHRHVATSVPPAAQAMPPGTGIPHVFVRAAETPESYSSMQTAASDGNFGARLREAQHAGDMHGVPGSDRRIVTGITLTPPMHQGVGAVLRSTQRLFGVTNSHCIDIDVWQNLSPEERIARHVSLKDMERINSQYDCQKPLGLSF